MSCHLDGDSVSEWIACTVVTLILGSVVVMLAWGLVWLFNLPLAGQ